MPFSRRNLQKLAMCGLRSLEPRFEQNGVLVVPRRNRHKDKWAEVRKTKSPTQLALAAFDGMYGSGPYEKHWASIRLGLTSTPKYCAVVNNFSANKEKVEERLRELGAVLLNEYFQNEFLVQPDLDFMEEKQPETEVTKKLRMISEGQDVFYELKEEEAEFVPATLDAVTKDEEATKPAVRAIMGPSGIRHPVLEDDSDITIPDHLRAYVFPRGDISRFPQPKQDGTGLYDYYLMDGASLFPVLALDVKAYETVLDMCAAPGGKSMSIMQTLLPRTLVCNDESLSRLRRLMKVIHSFVPSDLENPITDIAVKNVDATTFVGDYLFDKVLVDVPCTIDRVSCTVDENNFFTSRRSGERSRLPQYQLDILMSSCMTAKVGGTVVYSTCSLSPLQNDGVVHVAVLELKREQGIEMAVINTTPLAESLQTVYRFFKGPSCIYGQTILPFLPNNFGPSYCAKLKRLK